MGAWTTVTSAGILTWTDPSVPLLWDEPVKVYGNGVFGTREFGQSIKHPDRDLISLYSFGIGIFGTRIYGQNAASTEQWKNYLYFGFGKYGVTPFGQGPYSEGVFDSVAGVE